MIRMFEAKGWIALALLLATAVALIGNSALLDQRVTDLLPHTPALASTPLQDRKAQFDLILQDEDEERYKPSGELITTLFAKKSRR